MLTPRELEAMRRSKDEYNKNLELVFQKIHEMLSRKAADYEQLTPIWYRMPFGSRSFAHEIFKKGDRITSLMEKDGDPINESLMDNVMDIASYALMWLAFLQTVDDQSHPVPQVNPVFHKEELSAQDMLPPAPTKNQGAFSVGTVRRPLTTQEHADLQRAHDESGS